MNYKYKEMSKSECISFIKRNSMCIMSTSYNNTPYSIPMYYEYNNDSESEIIIEMISKSDGNKIKILKENDVITICIVKKILRKTFSVICMGNVFLDDTLEMMKIRINVKSVSGRIYNS